MYEPLQRSAVGLVQPQLAVDARLGREKGLGHNR